MFATLEEMVVFGIDACIEVEIEFEFEKADEYHPGWGDYVAITDVRVISVQLFNVLGEICPAVSFGYNDAEVREEASIIARREVMENEQKYIDRLRGG